VIREIGLTEAAVCGACGRFNATWDSDAETWINTQKENVSRVKWQCERGARMELTGYGVETIAEILATREGIVRDLPVIRSFLL
jgi:hypothetical protein